MAIAVLGARILLRRLTPGTYRRGGSEHMRVWLAERIAEASGAENQAGAPWLVYYARALGNKVGKGVDLHSAPPVTGMLSPTMRPMLADHARGRRDEEIRIWTLLCLEVWHEVFFRNTRESEG